MTHDTNPWDDPPTHKSFTGQSAQEAHAPVPGRIDRLDFMQAIARNHRNTWILIVGMLLLAFFFGYALGWSWDAALGGTVSAGMQYATSQSVDFKTLLLTPSEMGLKVGGAFFAGMLLWSVIALVRADKVVLGMADAELVDDGMLPQLHNLVEEMAIAAGLPKPKIVLLRTEMANAFATGLKPEKATIGVTQGLMRLLNRREMQAVIAHEMAHIRNDDMRYATILAVMAGVLVFIAEMVLSARHFLHFGAIGGRRDGRGGGHPFMFIIMIVVFIVTAILVPLLARLIQMAISRQREYMADATAVQLTRDPGGLISALQKIANAHVPENRPHRALEPLYIVTPAQMLQNSHKSWFSTHPPIEKRVERLKALE